MNFIIFFTYDGCLFKHTINTHSFEGAYRYWSDFVKFEGVEFSHCKVVGHNQIKTLTEYNEAFIRKHNICTKCGRSECEGPEQCQENIDNDLIEIAHSS